MVGDPVYSESVSVYAPSEVFLLLEGDVILQKHAADHFGDHMQL